MKKSDLKDWMIVETNEGARYCVKSGKILGDSRYNILDNYEEDLTNEYVDLTIKKVYNFNGYNITSVFDDDNLELLWKREDGIVSQEEYIEKHLHLEPKYVKVISYDPDECWYTKRICHTFKVKYIDEEGDCIIGDMNYIDKNHCVPVSKEEYKRAKKFLLGDIVKVKKGRVEESITSKIIDVNMNCIEGLPYKLENGYWYSVKELKFIKSE